LLIALVLTFAVTLVLKPSHPAMQILISGVIVPVEAALMAIISVSLLAAAIHLLRKRADLMSIDFLATVVLILAGSLSLPSGQIPVLGDTLRSWMTKVLSLGGARGILIGVALGSLIPAAVIAQAGWPTGVMMADVICPVPGFEPAGALTCFNCLSASEIRPAGRCSPKKGTGELEPILPEWLRTAREKSRQSTGSQIEEPEEKTQPVSDLLAGLEAQSKPDDGEEVPDWLARITGATGRKKNEPEQGGVRRVELGKPEADDVEETQPAKPVARPPASAPEDETPPWLKALAETDKDDGVDRLEDWFKQASAETGAEAAPPAGMEESGAQGTGNQAAEEQSLGGSTAFKAESMASRSAGGQNDLLEWLEFPGASPSPGASHPPMC
jgi:hypothetical protein